MKKKMRITILATTMCMLFGSITVFAETKEFHFSVKQEQYDTGVWTASKADDEQTAYVTPTSITGKGIIWAAVYDSRGGTQYTVDVGISDGDENVRKTADYYNEGHAGTIYRIIAGDSEHTVTSKEFKASGRWTP